MKKTLLSLVIALSSVSLVRAQIQYSLTITPSSVTGTIYSTSSSIYALSTSAGPSGGLATNSAFLSTALTISGVQSSTMPTCSGSFYAQWVEEASITLLNGVTGCSAQASSSYDHASESGSVAVNALYLDDKINPQSTSTYSGSSVVFVQQPDGTWTGSYPFYYSAISAVANLIVPSMYYPNWTGYASAQATLTMPGTLVNSLSVVTTQ